MEKLANKLSGWKKKALSMAGRLVLIKSVALSVPSYSMQTFQLPASLLKKMEGMTRQFFWGFDDSQSHPLHLKSWSTLCLPKNVGGLGLRKMKDLNLSLLTKLAWTVQTKEEQIWVKLIRSKYLRGRRSWDAEQTRQTASWIWGGIRGCINTLKLGFCFQVGKSSLLRLTKDPWLYNWPSFRLLANLHILENLLFVRDIMDETGLQWNQTKINAIFPADISSSILQTPIIEEESDRAVWVPSLTGKYTVKSTYSMLIQARIPSPTDNRLWNSLWRSNLHGRHLLLLWKMLQNGLPTLDRLSRFLPLQSNLCYLCVGSPETIHHLVLDCPFTKLLWWQSPWQIRLESFQHLEVTEWLRMLLCQEAPLPLSAEEKMKLSFFLAVSMEHVWMARNQTSRGNAAPNWDETSRMVNRSFLKY